MGNGVGLLRDEDGEFTGEIGIIITVTEKVDQKSLPRRDRIPSRESRFSSKRMKALLCWTN
jgi:hypothetical protein